MFIKDIKRINSLTADHYGHYVDAVKFLCVCCYHVARQLSASCCNCEVEKLNQLGSILDYLDCSHQRDQAQPKTIGCN